MVLKVENTNLKREMKSGLFCMMVSDEVYGGT